MSSPCLSNTLLVFMCTLTNRSPEGPPFSTASPSPAILSLVPSSTPGGISIFIFFVLSTTPVPWHCLHGFFMVVPSPWHVLHVVTVWNMPKGVLFVCLPAPSASQRGE